MESMAGRIYLDLTELKGGRLSKEEALARRYNKNRTLLHYASGLGFKDHTKILIDMGIDVQLADDDGRAAIYYAVNGGIDMPPPGDANNAGADADGAGPAVV
jgi:ankyrin repeat protein